MTLVKMVGTKLSPVKATLAKVAMDQLAFAPVFNGSFLTVIGLLQGKSLGNINEKLKKEYKDVMLTNWKVRNGNLSRKICKPKAFNQCFFTALARSSIGQLFLCAIQSSTFGGELRRSHLEHFPILEIQQLSCP